MSTSYIGGKVPRLIVRFGIYRDIIVLKKIPQQVGLDPASSYLKGEYHRHWTIETSMDYGIRKVLLCQQTIFLINLGIFHHISWNVGARKNLSYFWKISTNILENIFPKYLL
jgi:hypothetical protein